MASTVFRGAKSSWPAPVYWVLALTLVQALGRFLPAAKFFSSPELYLPLHILLEFLSMAISGMVVVQAWHHRALADNNRQAFIGAGFLAVLLIDLAHTLSFKGMPVFVTPSDPEKAINFWLVGRAVAAGTLMIMALIKPAHWSPARFYLLYSAGVVLSGLTWWIGLYHADWFPRTFVPGTGLTAFKIGAEYFLVLAYAVGAWFLLRNSRRDRNDNELWLAAAAWVLALAEMFFTLYADVTDLFNLLGHIYKVIAFVMIYLALLKSEFTASAPISANRGAAGPLASVGGVVLIFVMVVGLATHSLWQSRTALLDRTNNGAETLVVVVERFVYTSFHESEVLLHMAADEYHDLQQRRAFDVAAFERYLGEIRRRIPAIANLRYADKDGIIRYSETGPLVQPADISDRPYFSTLRAGTAKLVISTPLVGKVSKEWVIPVALRLEGPQGQFEGILVANLKANHFSELFASMKVPAKSAIILFDASATINLRHPEPKGPGSAIGLKVGSPEFKELWQQGVRFATYRGRSTTDGVWRTYSYRQVGDYPLFAMVGLSEDEIMAEWAGELASTSVFISFLGVTLAILLMLHQRSLTQERQSAQFMRGLIEASRDPLVTLDLHGKITDSNAAIEAATGQSRAHLAGREFASIFTNPDEMRAGFERVLTQGALSNLALEIRSTNGKVAHVLLSANILHDARGAVAGVFAAARDVTDKIRQEQELVDQRLRMQAIIDSTTDAIYLKDTEGRYLLANRAVCLFTGKPVEAILGHDDMALFSAEDARFVMTSDRKIMADGAIVVLEEPVRTADGEQRTFLTTKGPLKDSSGKLIGLFGVARDITERKNVEVALINANRAAEEANRALTESEANLRLLFDDAPDAYLIMDLKDGRILACNQAAGRMLRGSREQIVGRTPDQLSPPFQPDGRTSAESVPEKIIAVHEKKYHRFEWVHRRLDGEDFWVEVTISLGSYARSQALFVAWREIGEIISAKIAAESANVAKSRFLATMSHEIRTPMNGILGMAQMLLMPEVRESERLDYARTIMNSGQTLLALLNDILDLSKIEAGKLEMNIQAFSPGQLAQEIAALFSGAAHAKGLRLEANWLGAPRQLCKGDAHRLRQMLSNLVGNAIKFTEQGSISVEVRPVSSAGQRMTMEFSVSDTGMGVEPAIREQLFAPFTQADSSITRKYGGSGLGLSIVHALAKQMNGDVGVESVPGKGSRFWFRIQVEEVLPTEESRIADRPEYVPPMLAAPTLAGRVLVVEDNPTNQKVVAALLQMLGLSFTIKEDGQQGVAAAQSGDFDLILMDLHMPLMDGYEATQHIRTAEMAAGRPPRPIIALTADAFEEDRAHCLSVGMSDFLAKPIDLTALRDTLGKYLPQAAQQAPASAPMEPPVTQALDTDRFRAVLRELVPLLENQSFNALAKFEELLTIARGTSLEPTLRGMEALMNDMRFDLVLGKLRDLASAQGLLLEMA